MTQKPTVLLAFAAGLALTAPVLHAEDDPTPVVEEGETPEDAVAAIALPESAAAQAQESAASGLETANAARQTQGAETAAEARELGREFGERMAEEARDRNPGEQIRETASDARRDAALDRRPALPERPAR